MWYQEEVLYQIYPMGYVGAPTQNDGIVEARILKVIDWIPHMKKLGIGGIYFSPIFDSDSHGYDTRDYRKIDVRLGTFDDFKLVADKLHENNIKIILDGVFNHVGRGFFAFQDVLSNREHSRYLSWFNISLDGNSNYNDGLWYEGWEGHYDLVKLNLRNDEVIDYLLDSVGIWIDEFNIDGIRLDVAYLLPHYFVKRLREYCDSKKNDFFLVGELLHGDYKTYVNQDMLQSATNYECYKGLHSAINSNNLFEIMHSLSRQFGPEPWTLYKGLSLLSFVDNHDVSRIATILKDKRHIPVVYALMIAMPGIPCIYYGSEWGCEGDKKDGDWTLRPSYNIPEWNELTDWISSLISARNKSKAIKYGNFNVILLTNKQCVFQRCIDGDRVLVAINIDDSEYMAHFDAGCGQGIELITGDIHDFGGGSLLPPYSAKYIMCEK